MSLIVVCQGLEFGYMAHCEDYVDGVVQIINKAKEDEIFDHDEWIRNMSVEVYPLMGIGEVDSTEEGGFSCTYETVYNEILDNDGFED